MNIKNMSCGDPAYRSRYFCWIPQRHGVPNQNGLLVPFSLSYLLVGDPWVLDGELHTLLIWSAGEVRGNAGAVDGEPKFSRG